MGTLSCSISHDKAAGRGNGVACWLFLGSSTADEAGYNSRLNAFSSTGTNEQAENDLATVDAVREGGQLSGGDSTAILSEPSSQRPEVQA